MLASCQTNYHKQQLSLLLREKKTLKLCQKQDHSQIDCQALTSTDSRVLCVGAGGAVLRHLVASKLCLRLELGSTGATLVTIPGK